MRHPEKATETAVKRAEWKQPEVLRMEAGMAEIGSQNKTDALNTAS